MARLLACFARKPKTSMRNNKIFANLAAECLHLPSSSVILVTIVVRFGLFAKYLDYVEIEHDSFTLHLYLSW